MIIFAFFFTNTLSGSLISKSLLLKNFYETSLKELCCWNSEEFERKRPEEQEQYVLERQKQYAIFKALEQPSYQKNVTQSAAIYFGHLLSNLDPQLKVRDHLAQYRDLGLHIASYLQDYYQAVNKHAFQVCRYNSQVQFIPLSFKNKIYSLQNEGGRLFEGVGYNAYDFNKPHFDDKNVVEYFFNFKTYPIALYTLRSLLLQKIATVQKLPSHCFVALFKNGQIVVINPEDFSIIYNNERKSEFYPIKSTNIWYWASINEARFPDCFGMLLAGYQDKVVRYFPFMRQFLISSIVQTYQLENSIKEIQNPLSTIIHIKKDNTGDDLLSKINGNTTYLTTMNNHYLYCTTNLIGYFYPERWSPAENKFIKESFAHQLILSESHRRAVKELSHETMPLTGLYYCNYQEESPVWYLLYQLPDGNSFHTLKSTDSMLIAQDAYNTLYVWSIIDDKHVETPQILFKDQHTIYLTNDYSNVDKKNRIATHQGIYKIGDWQADIQIPKLTLNKSNSQDNDVIQKNSCSYSKKIFYVITSLSIIVFSCIMLRLLYDNLKKLRV